MSGNNTRNACARNKRKSGPVRKSSRGGWTIEEDNILRKAVKKNNFRNWKIIAKELPGRSHTQCLHRWQKVLDPSLIKGAWSKEEDKKIIELVDRYGAENWSMIASYLNGRIGKQCRERYINHLDPDLKKGPWNEGEVKILLEKQEKLGNRWAEISKFIKGRTDNACKNQYNSIMARKKRKIKHVRNNTEEEKKFKPIQKKISEEENQMNHLQKLLENSFKEQENLFNEFLTKNNIIERNQKLLLTKFMGDEKKFSAFLKRQEKQRNQFLQSIRNTIIVYSFPFEVYKKANKPSSSYNIGSMGETKIIKKENRSSYSSSHFIKVNQTKKKTIRNEPKKREFKDDIMDVQEKVILKDNIGDELLSRKSKEELFGNTFGNDIESFLGNEMSEFTIHTTPDLFYNPYSSNEQRFSASSLCSENDEDFNVDDFITSPTNFDDDHYNNNYNQMFNSFIPPSTRSSIKKKARNDSGISIIQSLQM